MVFLEAQDTVAGGSAVFGGWGLGVWLFAIFEWVLLLHLRPLLLPHLRWLQVLGG